MKKVLLSSSAIVGLAFAGSASAADPIQIGISGNLQTALTFNAFGGTNAHGRGVEVNNRRANASGRGGVTTNKDALHFVQDWDLNFTGSTTLENGLTVGVYLQLDSSGDGAGADPSANEDEVYAIISGGFGEFRIGQDDEALNDLVGSYTPNGGSMFGIDDGSYDVTLSSSAGNITEPDNSIADNSAMIWYRTPNFNGFRLTASYAPDDNQRPADQPTQVKGTNQDAWSLAAEYENSFSGVDLGVYAAYSQAHSTSTDAGVFGTPYAYLAGATIGFGGVTFGGGYTQREEGTIRRGTAGMAVNYKIDKVGVGVQGMYGFERGPRDAAVPSASPTDRGWGIQVDGSYALGPGITFGAAIGYSAYDFGSIETAGQTRGNIQGIGVGTSLAINF